MGLVVEDLDSPDDRMMRNVTVGRFVTQFSGFMVFCDTVASVPNLFSGVLSAIGSFPFSHHE